MPPVSQSQPRLQTGSEPLPEEEQWEEVGGMLAQAKGRSLNHAKLSVDPTVSEGVHKPHRIPRSILLQQRLCQLLTCGLGGGTQSQDRAVDFLGRKPL